MNKPGIALSEVPEKGSIHDEYYLRMMSPHSFKMADPFIHEETEALEEVIDSLTKPRSFNTIAIGAGQLAHLKLALEKTKSYTSIEPLTDLYMGSQLQYLVSTFDNIKLLKNVFAATRKTSFFDGYNLFIFLFNIISYLEDPLKTINKLTSPGDILFFTTWNYTEKSKEVRKQYFNYLNSFEKDDIIDPDKSIGLSNLRAFPFKQLQHYKRHFLIEGTITDILVVYL